jgi:hypothetical protein
MNLDTAMLNIELLANSGDPLHLPYTITQEGVVIDACEQRLTTRFSSAAQDVYLVACANAAPEMVAEVRRLRAELEAARLAVSLIERRPLTDREIAHASTLVDAEGRLLEPMP